MFSKFFCVPNAEGMFFDGCIQYNSFIDYSTPFYLVDVNSFLLSFQMSSTNQTVTAHAQYRVNGLCMNLDFPTPNSRVLTWRDLWRDLGIKTSIKLPLVIPNILSLTTKMTTSW